MRRKELSSCGSRDGVITNLIIQNGHAVTVGQRLLSILPEGSLLQAELWLPSRAVGFLETGNRVVLRYPSFPYQKFGQKGGRVLEVSRSATDASELTNLLGRTISEPLYRVLVTLDQQTVTPMAGGTTQTWHDRGRRHPPRPAAAH